MTFRQFAYRNVIRNQRIYAAYFMASVCSVMVFFIYSMLMYHPKVENEFMIEIAFRGMYFAQIVLVLFMLFFLFYSMRAFLEARSKEFGILIHLGMERQQLNKLVRIETTIIGVASIIVGILFGFAFSKFFFMVIREILQISALPLYFSWKPFALTIATFLTLFIVVSYLSVWTIKDGELVHLLRGTDVAPKKKSYSKVSGIAGLLILACTYFTMVNIEKSNLLWLAIVVPPVMMIGTYLFFTDSVVMIIMWLRKSKWLYWRKYRLISWSEYATMVKENAKMFFISSLVSTLAFMAIGTLSSMSTFTHQYHQINPVSIIYTSKYQNSYEDAHIDQLTRELQEANLSYQLTALDIRTQTSANSSQKIEIIDEQQFNQMVRTLKLPTVQLGKGEAIFLPYSEDSYAKRKNMQIATVLEENHVPITIRGAYKTAIFSAEQLGTNVIILNTADFKKIIYNVPGSYESNYVNRVYAFNVGNWTETQYIGKELDQLMTNTYASNMESQLPFYYENTGIDYEILRSTFALILFIGILASAVFFLAAGSFIYFKLYATLPREQQQYTTLRQMGVTDREIRQLVNRQLIPQFFLPWGVAVLNSCFAFIGLQVFWYGVADISIFKTIVIMLGILTTVQLLYFYLIRWRYLAHLR
ncbi:FtsX-like permease family protein [Kurthia senegalensis]|uniref:FtsX-like permease family protein n=1 Tax=Kurthia senegalensis TaxID=1033740 RepID=UPI00028A00C5|nr:ABC transporter permease [Kurthia senegalensis]